MWHGTHAFAMPPRVPWWLACNNAVPYALALHLTITAPAFSAYLPPLTAGCCARSMPSWYDSARPVVSWDRILFRRMLPYLRAGVGCVTLFHNSMPPMLRACWLPSSMRAATLCFACALSCSLRASSRAHQHNITYQANNDAFDRARTLLLLSARTHMASHMPCTCRALLHNAAAHHKHHRSFAHKTTQHVFSVAAHERRGEQNCPWHNTHLDSGWGRWRHSNFCARAAARAWRAQNRAWRWRVALAWWRGKKQKYISFTAAHCARARVGAFRRGISSWDLAHSAWRASRHKRRASLPRVARKSIKISPGDSVITLSRRSGARALSRVC